MTLPIVVVGVWPPVEFVMLVVCEMIALLTCSLNRVNRTRPSFHLRSRFNSPLKSCSGVKFGLAKVATPATIIF